MIEQKKVVLTKSQEKFLYRMRKYMYKGDIQKLREHMENGTKFIHGADIMDNILIVDKEYEPYYFKLKKYK